MEVVSKAAQVSEVSFVCQCPTFRPCFATSYDERTGPHQAEPLSSNIGQKATAMCFLSHFPDAAYFSAIAWEVFFDGIPVPSPQVTAAPVQAPTFDNVQVEVDTAPGPGTPNAIPNPSRLTIDAEAHSDGIRERLRLVARLERGFRTGMSAAGIMALMNEEERQIEEARRILVIRDAELETRRTEVERRERALEARMR